MPRLTADEAAELNVTDEEYVDVSTEEYLAKRDALMDKAETHEEVVEIARKYPHPMEMAQREEEEGRANATYEGHNRELSSEEERQFHDELEAAPDVDASNEVLRKYGRLSPDWVRENSY